MIKSFRLYLNLLSSLSSAVDQADYVSKAASTFSTTETALKEDLQRAKNHPVLSSPVPVAPNDPTARDAFTRTEITLALFLLYPKLRNLLPELIPPDEPFAAAVYEVLKSLPEGSSGPIQHLLSPEDAERLSILQLFAEFHGFADWGESLAVREIRNNCGHANREMLQRKQREISQKLIEARNAGRIAEEAQLSTQYQEVLKLAKMAS